MTWPAAVSCRVAYIVVKNPATEETAPPAGESVLTSYIVIVELKFSIHLSPAELDHHHVPNCVGGSTPVITPFAMPVTVTPPVPRVLN